MWRALFLAIGLTTMLVGLEFLFVEQIVIKKLGRKSAKNSVTNSANPNSTNPNDPFQTASYQVPYYQNSAYQQYSPYQNAGVSNGNRAFNGNFNSGAFNNASVNTSAGNGVLETTGFHTYRPKEWMPWSMLAVGAIIVIYTFTLGTGRRYSEE